jgi:hypothetical protein
VTLEGVAVIVGDGNGLIVTVVADEVKDEDVGIHPITHS